MISSKFIKVSLVCLLGLATLCLVVFEMSLSRHLTFLKVAMGQRDILWSQNSIRRMFEDPLQQNRTRSTEPSQQGTVGTAGMVSTSGGTLLGVVAGKNSSLVRSPNATKESQIQQTQGGDSKTRVNVQGNAGVGPGVHSAVGVDVKGGVHAENSAGANGVAISVGGANINLGVSPGAGPGNDSAVIPKPIKDSAAVVREQKPRTNGTQSLPVLNLYASVFSQTVPDNKQIVFEPKAQIDSNGSRPVACASCFNTEFTILMKNPDVCKTRDGSGQIDLILMVLTTHGAVDRRQAIRDTWASVTRNNTANVRHVFLLGWSAVESAMRSVEEEQARYADIVMHDFLDSYSNLTLKTMSGLRWAVNRCGNARFFMKTDDDMWVNVPSLLDTVKREGAALQTAVGGACHKTAKPIRNRHSKWYASPRAYPQSDYPGFCSGTGYVSSLSLARNVISVSPNVPFFYLEDVYLALCIQRLGGSYTLKGLMGFYHAGGNPCVLRSPETVTVHQVPPHRLREIWNAKCGPP